MATMAMAAEPLLELAPGRLGLLPARLAAESTHASRRDPHHSREIWQPLVPLTPEAVGHG